MEATICHGGDGLAHGLRLGSECSSPVLLHVDAHLLHGLGTSSLADGSLQATLAEFVGRARHLAGSAG